MVDTTNIGCLNSSTILPIRASSSPETPSQNVAVGTFDSVFELVHRPHGDCWLHKEKPVWIVEYSATKVRARHFQAYRTVKPVPLGRDPWSIDNRRIGTEDGFETLDAAEMAANDYEMPSLQPSS